MATSTLRQRPAAATVVKDVSSSDGPVGFTPPSITIKEVLNAIPKHCFERSAIKSSAYVLLDFAMIAGLATAVTQVTPLVGYSGSVISGYPGVAAKAAAWALYWWFQGLVCTGIWVIAHECGHQAYSTSKTINNTVGWFLHSALLVPYHSWRISHGRHHAATGHLTRDEVFVPRTASQRGIKEPEPTSLEKLDDLLEDAPLYNLVCVLGQQLLGWPLYLIRNASGQLHYPAYTNHFSPKSVIFDVRHYWQIIASDLGLVLAISVLTLWVQATSLWNVVCYYGIPYLLVNHWLVLITFLQHTDPDLPHYREGEWNFTRGALATMDRHVYDFFTHKIASTHILHHLCSRIPHYHADEATEAIKEVLGDYYTFSHENWLTSLFKVHNACKYVDDDGDVVFFKDARGVAKRKVVYESTDSGVDVDGL